MKITELYISIKKITELHNISLRTKKYKLIPPRDKVAPTLNTKRNYFKIDKKNSVNIVRLESELIGS